LKDRMPKPALHIVDPVEAYADCDGKYHVAERRPSSRLEVRWTNGIRQGQRVVCQCAVHRRVVAWCVALPHHVKDAERPLQVGYRSAQLVEGGAQFARNERRACRIRCCVACHHHRQIGMIVRQNVLVPNGNALYIAPMATTAVGEEHGSMTVTTFPLKVN
jgi:hypothetical protein